MIVLIIIAALASLGSMLIIKFEVLESDNPAPPGSALNQTENPDVVTGAEMYADNITWIPILLMIGVFVIAMMAIMYIRAKIGTGE